MNTLANESVTDTSERYRVNDLMQFPMGQSQELVYCPLTGTAQILPKMSVRVLQECSKFATLDEHALRVCNELGIELYQVRGVRQQLEEWAASGLLVSNQALLEQCANESDGSDTQLHPAKYLRWEFQRAIAPKA